MGVPGPLGLLLLGASLALVSGDKKLLNCFDRTPGRAIANAVAMAEFWHVTPYDCMHWCLKQVTNSGVQCQYVVYHSPYWSCQLYGPIAAPATTPTTTTTTTTTTSKPIVTVPTVPTGKPIVTVPTVPSAAKPIVFVPEVPVAIAPPIPVVTVPVAPVVPFAPVVPVAPTGAKPVVTVPLVPLRQAVRRRILQRGRSETVRRLLTGSPQAERTEFVSLAQQLRRDAARDKAQRTAQRRRRLRTLQQVRRRAFKNGQLLGRREVVRLNSQRNASNFPRQTTSRFPEPPAFVAASTTATPHVHRELVTWLPQFRAAEDPADAKSQKPKQQIGLKEDFSIWERKGLRRRTLRPAKPRPTTQAPTKTTQEPVWPESWEESDTFEEPTTTRRPRASFKRVISGELPEVPDDLPISLEETVQRDNEDFRRALSEEITTRAPATQAPFDIEDSELAVDEVDAEVEEQDELSQEERNERARLAFEQLPPEAPLTQEERNERARQEFERIYSSEEGLATQGPQLPRTAATTSSPAELSQAERNARAAEEFQRIAERDARARREFRRRQRAKLGNKRRRKFLRRKGGRRRLARTTTQRSVTSTTEAATTTTTTTKAPVKALRRRVPVKQLSETQRAAIVRANIENRGRSRVFSFERTKKLLERHLHRLLRRTKRQTSNVNAFTVPATGHDLYARTSSTGECASPDSPAGPAPPPPPPPQVLGGKASAVGLARNRNQQTTLATLPPPVVTLPPATTTTTTTTQAPVDLTSCADGFLTGYLVALGQEFGSNAVTPAVILDTDDTFCAVSCTDGLDEEGQLVGCLSYSFNPLTRECRLFPAKTIPDGPFPLKPNEDAIHSAKVCLPDPPIACAEDEIFLHFPTFSASTPVGAELSQGVFNSLEECLQDCVATTGRGDGACKSLLYNALSRQCTQYSVDTLTPGVSLIPGADGDHYVENGCISNAQRLNLLRSRVALKILPNQNGSETTPAAGGEASSASWGGWSPCQYNIRGQNLRVRTRGCSIHDCRPRDLQVDRCGFIDIKPQRR